MLSPIETVVELTVVVVPDIVKLPLTVTSAPLKPNAVLNELVNVLRLLVAVCNVPITVLLEPVYVFNKLIDPVTPSSDVNLPFCVVSTVLLELVKLLKSLLILLKSLLILELALSKDVNLPLALEVNVFKLLVAVCNVPITVLFEPV